TKVVQLFYQATDNTVRSIWRNHDGSWSAEQNLGGAAISEIATIVVPGTDVLQLFYYGTKGVSSLWREPDGSWSAEQQLGGDAASDITVALVPFAIGSGLFVSVYKDQQHFTYRDASAE